MLHVYLPVGTLVTSQLLQNRCTRCQKYVTVTKEYLFLSSIIFTQIKSEFTELHLLKFLYKSEGCLGDIKESKIRCLLLKHSVYLLYICWRDICLIETVACSDILFLGAMYKYSCVSGDRRLGRPGADAGWLRASGDRSSGMDSHKGRRAERPQLQQQSCRHQARHGKVHWLPSTREAAKVSHSDVLRQHFSWWWSN